MEQAGLKFSIEKLQEVLKKDQYSVIEDQRTGKRYSIRQDKPAENYQDKMAENTLKNFGDING